MREMVGVGDGTGALGSVIGSLTTLLSDEYTLIKSVRKDIAFVERELRRMQILVNALADMEELDEVAKDFKGSMRDLSYDMKKCIDRFMLRLGNGDAKPVFVKRTPRRLQKGFVRHSIRTKIKELELLLNQDQAAQAQVREEDESGATPPHEFTFGFLNRITNNFSEERIIGCGGHGVVYKGVQDNGEYIAVKKLHLMPGFDDEELKNDFNNLMRVQHQNTIRFVGYCHHTTYVLAKHNGKHVPARVEERYLCSEYLQGGSLDKHLSNEPCELSWDTCYKIIKGICEGLHYLHKGFEYPIYHLELRPTKILLDKDMMPKIGGFGFSRLFDSIETFNTSTSVYMPPEYISKRQITPTFDVFSLGVIILQIMAGKERYTKCADIPPEEFIEHIYESWVNRKHGTTSKHTSREIRTCIEIALKCVESNQVKRPTINQIIQRLNKIDIVECSSIGELYRIREFAFEFLERITNDFSDQNKVGSGGYGHIYKGVLDNGEEIAVKKLHQMVCIDDEQFKNEVNNLMRVQHKNIVRLVGYCHHTSQIFVEYKGKHVSASVVERAICFEYMQGGSLDDQLSAESCKLDWDKCYKIIKGICEGLHYLHNFGTPIYHLDLKPANILLDKDMVAKIGDFGLSRLFDSAQTYMTASRDLKGTLGYMPPEYINGQKISPKFDVFSLGVIIIQIMAGKEGYFNCRDTHPKDFIEHVHEKWRVRLQATMSSHVSEEVRTCIKIALKCVEDDRNQRPKIAQIVDELSNIGIAKSSPVGQVQATKSPRVSEEVRTCIEIVLKCVEDDRTRRQIVNELSKIGIAKSSPISQDVGTPEMGEVGMELGSSGVQEQASVELASHSAAGNLSLPDVEPAEDQRDAVTMCQDEAEDAAEEEGHINVVAATEPLQCFGHGLSLLIPSRRDASQSPVRTPIAVPLPEHLLLPRVTAGPLSAEETLWQGLSRAPDPSILGPRPSVSAPTRKKKTLPPNFTPRRSARLSKAAGGIKLGPVQHAQTVLLRQLGVIQAEEQVSDEALDEYIKLFDKPLAPHHVKAVIALFSPDEVDFDEPMQPGFSAFSLPDAVEPCGA